MGLHDKLQDLQDEADAGNHVVYPSRRRQPEANTEVYNLGHYEQMQIDLMFAQILDDGSIELNLDTLESLRSIFRSHGTITIVRHGEV